MRVVKFRGKSSNNVESPISDEIIVEKGQWIYGSLVNDAAPNEDGSTCLIHTNTEYGLQYFYVDPATIGQFIGVLDADGKEIYEGDIIQGNNQWIRHKIEYNEEEARFCAKKSDDHCPIYKWWIDEYEKKVIGNIHDNPEIII